MVKCEEIKPGVSIYEKFVYIQTTDEDLAEVLVSERSLEDGYLHAMLVIEADDQVLVELPRETTRGFWTIWVYRRNVKFLGKNPGTCT